MNGVPLQPGDILVMASGGNLYYDRATHEKRLVTER
jgi:hypothetical protein